jgi:hypothetical protein
VVVLKEGMTEAPPVVNVLGGGKVPHSVLVSTGVDQPVGTYKVKVTVADFQGKKEASFTKEFILLPPEFGIVRFQLSYDRAAQFPSGPAAALGQTVFVNFVLLGYKRDARNEGAAAVELSVQDAAGKPANLQPLTGEFKPITTANPFLQIRFDLPLHRAGQYKLILKATDHVAKKTVTLAVPFQVVEPR